MNFFKNASIKKKLVLSSLFVGIAISLIVSLFIYQYLNKKLAEEKIEIIHNSTIEQSHESTQLLEKNVIFIKMLATRTRVKEFLLDKSEERRLELSSIFDEYAKENSKYLSIYLLDTEGVALISTDKSFVGKDYSFRDYFQNAIKGESYVDISIGKTSNQFGYYFSYPVYDFDNKIIGVVVLKTDETEMKDAILNSEVSKNSKIMLVDKYGVIVVSSEAERYLRSLGRLSADDLSELNRTERFLDKKINPLQYDNVQKIIDNYEASEVVDFYDEEDAEREVMSVVRLGEHPFYIVTEIGMSGVRSLVSKTVNIVVLIIIAGFLLLSLISYKLVSSFINPLYVFIDASKSISSGDFNRKIDINTKDEFGVLSNVFNEMTIKLKESYTALEKKVKERTDELEKERGSLENKILERTKQLEELKNNLEKTVEERTRSLNDKLKEVEKMNNIMIDREAKMIELKKEVKELKDKLVAN